jgi:hypothetical protein
MERRTDERTAEKIYIALLTRAAFDQHTAITFARLAGLAQELVDSILARPPSHLRHYPSLFLLPPDRRQHSR